MGRAVQPQAFQPRFGAAGDCSRHLRPVASQTCRRRAKTAGEAAHGKRRGVSTLPAGLADTYSLLGDAGYLPPSEAWPKAKAAAMQALEIDDTLAEAHTSLALVKEHFEWDWNGAETEFRRAIELNPNSA